MTYPDAIEAPSEVAIEPEEIGSLTPYTFIWLVRDPETRLDDPLAEALEQTLAEQLREAHWQIHTLDVQSDHIYLFAELPGDQTGNELIRGLIQRSISILYDSDPALGLETFWADSYLVLTPGREMDIAEQQQFIDFSRM